MVHVVSHGGVRRGEERASHLPASLPVRSDYTPVQILHGRAWVIVDAAVLDVSSFAKRHPGGARLIMNSMGTDMTSEMIGEDASVGNSSMTFAPHPHSDVSSALGFRSRGAFERVGNYRRGYFRTIDNLVPSRLLYWASLWSFSSCHRSHALARKCGDLLLSFVYKC